MKTFGRTVRALLVAALCAGPFVATSAFAQAPKQQDEFVPLDQLPPQEQMPAAPLLVGAYSFVVVMLFLYLLSVGRRLTTVQREVERLETDLKRSGAKER